MVAGVSPSVEPWRTARRQNRSLKTVYPSHPNFHEVQRVPPVPSDLLTAQEPDLGRVGSPLHVVAMPIAEETVALTDRGSLAPQRGEGLRVRGEIAQIV